jgi:multisubunit Na+/H+ antiporter MnhE subunit
MTGIRSNAPKGFYGALLSVEASFLYGAILFRRIFVRWDFRVILAVLWVWQMVLSKQSIIGRLLRKSGFFGKCFSSRLELSVSSFAN